MGHSLIFSIYTKQQTVSTLFQIDYFVGNVNAYMIYCNINFYEALKLILRFGEYLPVENQKQEKVKVGYSSVGYYITRVLFRILCILII